MYISPEEKEEEERREGKGGKERKDGEEERKRIQVSTHIKTRMVNLKGENKCEKGILGLTHVMGTLRRKTKQECLHGLG